MALAELTQVKAKLGIAASETERNEAIREVLAAAEQYVLGRTGYVLETSTFTDTFWPGQLGQTLWLRHRPVVSANAAVRMYGSTIWTALDIEVLDPEAGKLVLPGPGGPAWLAWQAATWDELKVTYIARALTVPADLSDACAALAAYWYGQQQVWLGGEAWRRQMPIPPYVDAVLARHGRPHIWWV